MRSSLLTIIDSALDRVATEKASASLTDIIWKIKCRIDNGEFKSRYEKKAYRSALSYLEKERTELNKVAKQ